MPLPSVLSFETSATEETSIRCSSVFFFPTGRMDFFFYSKMKNDLSHRVTKHIIVLQCFDDAKTDDNGTI